jgi:DNA adenine methylase
VFGWDEQERLAEWLSKHPGPVVLSNQATKRIVKLYRDLGFKLKRREAPRMISCNGDRTKAIEVIAMRGL